MQSKTILSFYPSRKIRKVIQLFLLMMAFTTHSFAGVTVQGKTVKISESKISLSQLIKKIESQVSAEFVYKSEDLRAYKNLTVEKEGTVTDVLNSVLEGTGLKVQLKGDVYVISKKAPKAKVLKSKQKQSQEVKGTVTDEDGNTLPGVSVVVKGTTIGVTTAIDGNYVLKCSESAKILVFSFVGMKKQEIDLNGRSIVDIVLVQDNMGLDEVVVTALGIKRSEKSLGYSVQKVDGDAMQKVKGVDVATSLTGKVAGLNILNSTEFYEEPIIELRGERPLIIIDGIPYSNLSMRDVASDDIEEMSVLKGASASALYGARGSSGAIMITTKKGAKKNGLTISVNSNTMFNAGYLAKPEVQTSYSEGDNSKYNSIEYIWGDKMDIGREYEQWDPISKSYKTSELVSKGKNNLKNFQELSFITNNNVSLAQKGDNGSFRTSLTHVYNKGQFPNAKMNKITYSIGGELKVGEKFKVESNFTYNKRWAPNISGTGYNKQGYIYQMLIWSGANYDIRDYRDYWITPDEEQNWHFQDWTDNPYLQAYEKLQSVDEDKFNGFVSVNYQVTPWAKIILRSGLDYYVDRETKRNPIGIKSTRGWNEKGLFRVDEDKGFSSNSDLLLMLEKEVGKFRFDGVLGGSLYYKEDNNFYASTKNGISIPGFYSLKGSVEDAYVSTNVWKKQVNSLFAKASFSYKSALFLDITGRNDWSSTLPKDSRSYFYPSAGLSAIVTEMIDFKEVAPWLSFWKFRGSWAVSKKDLGIYATNNTYSTTTGAWDSFNKASYPTSLKDYSIKPSTERTFEYGTVVNFLNNRIRFDLTYYNKLMYNRTIWADISEASGFGSKLVNTEEELERKGWEVSLGVTPIKNKNLRWDMNMNWSKSHVYYNKLDPNHTADKYWIGVGERKDVYATSDYERTPDGQRIVKANGYPLKSDYDSKIGYYEPDWIWGLTNTIKYKNLTFLMSFDGRVGGLSYSSTNARMWQSGAHIDSDNKYRHEEVVNGQSIYSVDGMVVLSGDVIRDDYGRIVEDNREFAKNEKVISYESYNKYYGTGPQNILDETFIKLRELSISYNLPNDMVSKLGMKEASVSFVGQNLFMWAKEYRFADPDIASDDLNSPSIRYIGANVKLIF